MGRAARLLLVTFYEDTLVKSVCVVCEGVELTPLCKSSRKSDLQTQHWICEGGLVLMGRAGGNAIGSVPASSWTLVRHFG
mmetsp:Transcript_29405/g.85081  ORF Transcript_29405/g.85081 Transcript_29405/m.85081 type:complete len:80 (+) Transcript_29405:416-655(+)